MASSCRHARPHRFAHQRVKYVTHRGGLPRSPDLKALLAPVASALPESTPGERGCHETAYGCLGAPIGDTKVGRGPPLLTDERGRTFERRENSESRQQETSQGASTGNATARATMPRRSGDGMSDALPVTYLARHGETAWSLSGQHTGLTDLPLTERGEAHARRLAARLQGLAFAKVLTSPLQRAARTCELAGFGANAERDPDLLEWNYGAYEGRTSADIHRERPGWDLFRDGCPDGESPGEIASRADRVVDKVRAVDGQRPALLERSLLAGAGGSLARSSGRRRHDGSCWARPA